MNDIRKTAVLAPVETERPHSLVLHYAPPESGADLSRGDAEDRAAAFFTRALSSARKIPGLREVALELPQSLPEGRKLLDVVGRCAGENGFELRAVALAGQVQDWGTSAFSACREVALRIDTTHYPALKLTPGFYGLVDRLQADSKVVSFHVLLNSELLARLKLPRLRRWLDRADFVTLVAPRGLAADFSRSDLMSFFQRLAPLWEKADRFFHLQVDRSIKPAFFPWNLLSVTCPAADLALHLESDGSLSLCGAPQPFGRVAHPDELAALVARHLQSAEAVADLCEGLPFQRP